MAGLRMCSLPENRAELAIRPGKPATRKMPPMATAIPHLTPATRGCRLRTSGRVRRPMARTSWTVMAKKLDARTLVRKGRARGRRERRRPGTSQASIRRIPLTLKRRTRAKPGRSPGPVSIKGRRWAYRRQQPGVRKGTLWLGFQARTWSKLVACHLQRSGLGSDHAHDPEPAKTLDVRSGTRPRTLGEAVKRAGREVTAPARS